MKYLSITKNAIQTEMSYTALYWSNLIGLLLRFLTAYYLWISIFSGTPAIGFYTFEKMILYIFFSLLLSQINSFGAGRILSLMIARGEIAIELIRPYNLILKLLFYNLGVKISDTIKYILLLIILGLFLLPALFNIEANNWILFILSCIIGMAVIQLSDILLSFSAFYTTNTWGIWILRNSLITIFSGAMLPIDIYPSILQQIAIFLPFKSAIYDPIQILFMYDSQNIILLFTNQIIWLAILVFFISVSYKKTIKRIEIFGG